MKFSDKIKRARETADLTQQELADQAGISKRAVAAYETGGAIARRSTTERLAAALRVSVKYLMEEDCEDPLDEIEKDTYIQQTRALRGTKGVRDMDAILKEGSAMFAGGELTEEQKQDFCKAMFRAYMEASNEAKLKFGRKK